MKGDKALEARGLGKVIDGRPILRDIDLDVESGQVIGLLGKNGAGKSTLFDLLLGFALPSTGHCSVYGEHSAQMSAAVKARIGFVAQQDELISTMTGSQLLALTASFHARWDRVRIDHLAKDWGVALGTRIGKLSGGERQKLSTLVALGHDPDLLVLDEPASSLDPMARRQFVQTVIELAGDARRTILYASHIVSDIERVASHVWILRSGKIAWKGELDALKESVVRLRLSADRDLPPSLALPGQFTCEVSGRTALAVVGGWQSHQLQDLERQYSCRIEVEPIGLEDIFLAVHA